MFLHEEKFYEDRIAQLQNVRGNTWTWFKNDAGGWIMPIQDWNSSHYQKYFEHLPSDRRNTVITAGANQGLYTRAYSQMFEHVYAFEPLQQNFLSLVRNNHLPNVYFFKSCLGAKNGLTKILVSQDSQNYGETKISPNGQYVVPMMTIDSLQLKNCDLIQLDTEGFESEIIEGAKKTIKKYSPIIIAEQPSNDPDKKTLTLLQSLGYEHIDTSMTDYIYRKK